jgi:hypothetical protein
MALDAELWLSGDANSPIEDVSADHVGRIVDFGVGKRADVVVRVAGDVTGSSPTLDITIKESDDQATWTTLATVPQITDEMVGYIATATPRPEVPGEDPITISIKSTKRYLQADFNTGGTTPVFNDVSVVLEPFFAAI